MLTCCWSVKGGSGTTVVAAALAILASSRGDALLVDLAGDASAVLGAPEPAGPGVLDWLAAEPPVEADALDHLTTPAAPRLRVLPSGGAPPGRHPPGQRVDQLGQALRTADAEVVADLGIPGAALAPLLAFADQSLLVLRPCYLAIRRATALAHRPSGIVLVAEPGRALGRREVEDVVRAPVVAEIDQDPTIARAVDAGLLAARLPRGLARPLSRPKRAAA